MDLKGIAWVGHVYQKFEAMCLEVEEIMYQDTVKYVENQVLTVGSSVKTFYSDVIEDFLPPASVDLVKGKVASNLPAEQTDVGICKKPKVIIKEEAMKADNEQFREDLLATADLDKGAGHGQSFHGFHIENTSFQASSRDNIKGVACSDVYSKEYDVRCGHNHSSFCMPKISKEENFPPSEMSGEIPHMKRDLIRGSSSCELMDKNQEASDDHADANPSSVTIQVASCNSFEDIDDGLENASKGALGVLTSSPSAKNCDEIEKSSVHSSCSSLSAELNDICMSKGVDPMVGSFVNEDVLVQPSEFLDKITFVCHPGLSDFSTMDTLESSLVVDQGFETIQQVDNIQVEEACVLVNGDELRFVPHREGKPRPYKKKIQDAISSRMRSARKHEYKQLAVWCDEDVRFKQENAETKGSPSDGSCELEWELL